MSLKTDIKAKDIAAMPRTDGYALTLDATQPSGLKWAPSSGGLKGEFHVTLIALAVEQDFSGGS